MTEVPVNHIIGCYRCPDKYCRQIAEKPELGRAMYLRNNPNQYPIGDWQPISECLIFKKGCK
jgi:hypothetical protein